MFRTVRTALGSYVFLILISLPIFFTSLFKRTADIPHVLARLWARYTLTFADTKVEVYGKENIPDGPLIFMANHVSILGFVLRIQRGFINRRTVGFNKTITRFSRHIWIESEQETFSQAKSMQQESIK